MHISGIETGKIVPRYDTLLEIVRVLGQDLLMVPKELVPLVQALVRDHRRQDDDSYDDDGDRPLYAIFENEDENDEEEERRDEI